MKRYVNVYNKRQNQLDFARFRGRIVVVEHLNGTTYTIKENGGISYFHEDHELGYYQFLSEEATNSDLFKVIYGE